MSNSKSTLPGKAILFKGIVANYFGTFTTIAFAFVMTPYLVHTLGDTQYGVWSILISLTGYMLILDMGVISAIVKFVARYRALNDAKSLNEMISSALAVYIVISVVILLLAPLLASTLTHYIEFDEQIKDIVYLLFIITAIDVTVVVFRGLFEGILTGCQRLDILNALHILQSLVGYIAIFLVLYFGFGLLAMSIVTILVHIAILGLFAYYTKKFYPEIEVKLSLAKWDTAKQALNFGKYSFLSRVANQLVYYSDAFVIGFFLSAASVTYYTIASSLVAYTEKLVFGICSSFLPYFSGIESQDDSDALARSYVMGTKIVIAVSNLFCVGIFLLGTFFIEIWIGEKYAVISTPILLVLMTIQFFRGPQTMSYSMLQGAGRHQVYSYWQTAFSLANLFLSIVLVQSYGLMGVAAATAITQISFHGIVVPVLTLRFLNISAREYLQKTHIAALFPSSLLALTLYLLTSWREPSGYIMLLSQAALAAFVYAIAYFYCVLDTQDRQFVYAKFRGRFINTF